MKIYPSNLNHLRYSKPTPEEIQEQYYFPCSITVLDLQKKIAEVFYYDLSGEECSLGKLTIPSDYIIKKSLSKTDVAPTEVGLYPLKESGIYPNLNGLNAPTAKLNFASYDGQTWSLISINVFFDFYSKADIDAKLDIQVRNYIPKWDNVQKKYVYSSISDDGQVVTIENELKLLTKVYMLNIPTSPTGLPVGELWNDNGTLKIIN